MFLRSCAVLIASSALAVFVAGCTMTIEAVNPHPNVVVGASTGPISVDVSAVSDDKELEGVEIHQFKKSLLNGFHNAVGDKFVDANQKSLHLVITQTDMEMSNLGNIGRFLTIRYRAKWIGADGQLVAEVAGVAEPRNPTETGPRHLEDVIEVMYERMIEGFDRATHVGASNGAAVR